MEICLINLPLICILYCPIFKYTITSSSNVKRQIGSEGYNMNKANKLCRKIFCTFKALTPKYIKLDVNT